MVNSVKFGTSGLRGLAQELEGTETRRYVSAFLTYLLTRPELTVDTVYLAADYRPSSSAILNDCAIAIASAGLTAVDCGTLPTPALALYAMQRGGAAIMVTGSHIPADRNGLKFYLPTGEISKNDEKEISKRLKVAPLDAINPHVRDESALAQSVYIRRFADLLPEKSLMGLRIGVYEHTTVARDLLRKIIGGYGATVIPLGRADGFVPVDTEAFRDPVFAALGGWVEEYGLDAIVSADGDGDRPLMMDGAGHFVRGDALGLLAARYLKALAVVTPVTSNSAIEQTGYFTSVIRTKVGSPYVVEAMSKAGDGVIGFEANGGTFVGRGFTVGGHALSPLATRDAILPILCALGESVRQGLPLAQVHAELPLLHAVADRLQDVPSEISIGFIERLTLDPLFAAATFEPYGIIRSANIDGVQFWTRSGAMVHFRASGNAPELRCYVEADTAENARELLDWGLKTAANAVSRPDS